MKPPSFDDVEKFSDALYEIREQVLNLLAAASLPVSPAIHLEGLTGGLREIVSKVDALVPREKS